MGILTKIFGTKSDREIKKILPIVKQVNEFYSTLEGKDLSYLQDRTKELQTVIKESISEQESKKLNKIDDSKELKKNKISNCRKCFRTTFSRSFCTCKTCL